MLLDTSHLAVEQYSIQFHALPFADSRGESPIQMLASSACSEPPAGSPGYLIVACDSWMWVHLLMSGRVTRHRRPTWNGADSTFGLETLGVPGCGWHMDPVLIVERSTKGGS